MGTVVDPTPVTVVGTAAIAAGPAITEADMVDTAVTRTTIIPTITTTTMDMVMVMVTVVTTVANWHLDRGQG